MFPPLPKWLLKKAKEFNLEIQQGQKKYKNWKLDGWYIPTSGDYKLFWVSEEDRGKVQAKYLSPTGKGLQPILLMPRYGLVSGSNLPSEVLQGLEQEGFVLVEGFKGSLALCSIGFNACTIGGCNGGVATLNILSDWGISPHWIQRVFADTDILTNPKVTKAYSQLASQLPSAKISVHPPATFLNLEGGIHYRKDSPDDWIEEGFTKQMVYEKTTAINIQIITEQQEKQKNTFLQIQIYVTEKRIKQQMDLDMVHTLREFFGDNLFFLPRLNDYYVFDEKTCLWSHFDLEELTYFCLNKFEDRNWTFLPLQQAIKSASACAVRSWEALHKLFSSKHFIGFENG